MGLVCASCIGAVLVGLVGASCVGAVLVGLVGASCVGAVLVGLVGTSCVGAVLVDRMLWNCWLMCYFAVTTVFVRYFFTAVLVSPVQVANKPSSMAVIQVDIVSDSMRLW